MIEITRLRATTLRREGLEAHPHATSPQSRASGLARPNSDDRPTRAPLTGHRGRQVNTAPPGPVSRGTPRLAWASTLLIILALLSAAVAQQPQRPADDVPPAAASVRFRAFEIWLDTNDQPLAAWQIEFKPAEAFREHVKIVGIEGGAHEQFADPPYYDPAAMQQERVIIADFSTANADFLPRGRTRIATIHVQIDGEREPEFLTQATALATVDGRAIEASIEVIQSH